MTIEERAHKQAQGWSDPAIRWAVEKELIRFGKELQAIEEAETDKKIEEAKSNQLDRDITAAYHWAIARLSGTSQERQDMANDLMFAIIRASQPK